MHFVGNFSPANSNSLHDAFLVTALEIFSLDVPLPIFRERWTPKKSPISGVVSWEDAKWTSTEMERSTKKNLNVFSWDKIKMLKMKPFLILLSMSSTLFFVLLLL